MLRLVFTQAYNELYRCSYFVASCVTKRQVVRFLSVSSVCHHRVSTLTRALSTGSPVWKDGLQPKRENSEDNETVELDTWKSVMKAKAVLEGKQVGEEQEASDDDDENLEEPRGDLKESSSLEATRYLVAMWRQAGKLVPQEMTDVELQTLSELTTKSSRKKYLKYLSIKEHHKRAHKEKRQKRKAEWEASTMQMQEQGSDAEEGGDQKRLQLKNTLFLQLWSRSVDKLLAWRSAQAMLFGQPLVFDMSYASNMSKQEIENTVSQLMEMEGWNRRATEPFHLHFCNLQQDGAYKKTLLQRYGAETWDRLLITSTDRQHVDLFPCKQLVYLTADSPNVLRSFDHSKVYIIGALVDRSSQSGLSMANAKRLKLATARLPLDEFLQWETGAKNLTLDQMIRIMLTLKDTGNWTEALKFVPTRKHCGFYQHQTQKENKRGLTHRGPREDGDRLLRSGERSSERTFKNEDSLYRSRKEPGFTGRDTQRPSDDKNKSAAARVRTSFKSNMEARKGPDRSKMWWDDE